MASCISKRPLTVTRVSFHLTYLLILNNSWSTAVSSVFISTGQQKNSARRRSHGRTQRWTDNQNPCSRCCIGQSRALTVNLGTSLRIRSSGGIIRWFTPDQVLADKGYDSDAFVESIQRVGAEAVIPSRKNRQQPRPLDRHIYKDRNLVERFFPKLKQFRRIATRLSSYLAGIIESAL